MWQNPYSNTYNPLAPFQGQTDLNLFNTTGVITPPPNAAPFPAQPDIPTTAQPFILPGQPPNVLQPQIAEQMGQMVVTAMDNFKKSIIDTKEDGADMLLTVRIPTQILKQDPNFSFLFNNK